MANENIKQYLDRAGVELIKTYIDQQDNKLIAADTQHTADISANSGAIGVNTANISINAAAIAAEKARAEGVESQLTKDIAGAITSANGYTDSEVGKEKARAEAAEEAALKAGQDAQTDVDNLETYVGTIPSNYTEASIVAFINKKAEETLAAAQGETENQVKALAGKGNTSTIKKNADDIASLFEQMTWGEF